MKKYRPIIPLFKQFIKDSELGKRLKKNGERIKPNSISNYFYVLNNLVNFTIKTGFDLRICDVSNLSKKEYISEKKYWKNFYLKFTAFMYNNGCYDNYVGGNIKLIRTFFIYLKQERFIDTGDFQLQFYVRHENVEILVLSPDQLKFFIHDVEFEKSLTKQLKWLKDVFVFGCTTALRYSDIFAITPQNFEQQNEQWYLKVKSQKTKTYTAIKLPTYAVVIYKKYRNSNSKIPLFKFITLYNFNKNIKRLGALAGLTNPIETTRERQGEVITIEKSKEDTQYLFCDRMSSHMMRRTAITTLLILGMPDHLVRKISGHSAGSNSFNRYVHYAQTYIDHEIDKVHRKLEMY